MLTELHGELRRNLKGDGWQGSLIILGRTMTLVGTLAQDDSGKFLQIRAELFGAPYTEDDLDRLDYAKRHGGPVSGHPVEISGHTPLPKDPVPRFDGELGT